MIGSLIEGDNYAELEHKQNGQWSSSEVVSTGRPVNSTAAKTAVTTEKKCRRVIACCLSLLFNFLFIKVYLLLPLKQLKNIKERLALDHCLCLIMVKLNQNYF